MTFQLIRINARCVTTAQTVFISFVFNQLKDPNQSFVMVCISGIGGGELIMEVLVLNNR